MPTETKKTNLGRSRSDTLNMRIDPRLKYLADLAARESQRTLSGFIEWAIKRALTPEAMREDESNVSEPLGPMQPKPLWGEGFWNVDEADRAFLLASRRDLQSIEEQLFFKLFLTHMELSKKKASLKEFREFYKSVYVDGKAIKADASEGGE
jgi:hypothetical protein